MIKILCINHNEKKVEDYSFVFNLIKLFSNNQGTMDDILCLCLPHPLEHLEASGVFVCNEIVSLTLHRENRSIVHSGAQTSHLSHRSHTLKQGG